MDAKLEEAILSRVRRIVALWPAHAVVLPDQLQDFVTHDFESVDLANRVSAVAELSRIEVTDEDAAVEFWDVDGTLQRAVLRRDMREGEWKLQSLKFQCPVCFGTGLNDDTKCVGCGGIGWGGA